MIGHRKGFVADSELSFLFVDPDEIFPFYELRAAAPELPGLVVNWEDGAYVREYQENLRRRIGAQLDTLILNGVPRAILGAWGCGCFKNDPHRVALTYRQEIEKRAAFFEHLVFPILSVRYSETANFQVFKEHLDGIKLGPEANKQMLADERPSPSM